MQKKKPNFKCECKMTQVAETNLSFLNDKKSNVKPVPNRAKRNQFMIEVY